MTRSIEALVEEQAHRWQLVRAERREEPRRPVVTVSRQHGAGGAEVARTLAAQLGFDLFDREIIQRIAESTHPSERVVASLDEKDRELLADWLSALSSRGYLSMLRAWTPPSPTSMKSSSMLWKRSYWLLSSDIQFHALRRHLPLRTRVEFYGFRNARFRGSVRGL